MSTETLGAASSGALSVGAASSVALVPASSSAPKQKGPLHLREVLMGRRLVVVGGTGFLGKVWWAMVLHHFPELEHIYLVVRERRGQTAEQRFWAEIATSEVMTPLRERYGDRYEAFMRQKLTPIPGDVSLPFCGLGEELRAELRGNIDAVVNAAGVVDFDPPLDQALDVNAFGVQNLICLVKDLSTKLMHTSTCFTAGDRTGFIEEQDPRLWPFPLKGKLKEAHWDPEREIAECLDVIKQARHRAGDNFRQSHFLDQARHNLEQRGEPARGPALTDEIEKVRRRFIEAELARLGTERAKFWGWSNTYTYTKSIGEQIIVSSGVPCTIVRPAIIESSCEFPVKGWAEGINTSAPLIYSLREGQTQIPGSDNYLDFIPCDMVAGGMILSLAELIEGTHEIVYQYGSSDTNPCTMRRFFELSGLYKRKYYQRTGRGGPLLSYVQAHFEGALLDEPTFRKLGPMAIGRASKGLSKLLKGVGVGPAAPILSPLSKAVASFGSQQEKVGGVLGQFIPFVCQYHYIFRCDNTRAANLRLSEEERALVMWRPETIDWRQWFMEVHIPGLEAHVFPLIDERVRKERPAPRHHETLTELLFEMASRYDLAVALQRTEPDGLSRLSFREWRDRGLAGARRLAEAGVLPGDRVVLAGANHPAWPIAFFSILLAGATVVPVEAGVEAQVLGNLQRASGAQVLVTDLAVRERCQGEVSEQASWLEYEELTQAGALPPWGIALPSPSPADDPLPELAPEVVSEAERRRATPDGLACLIYTSGTTGNPKGVMLTHKNLTALVASLAPLFPLKKRDRVLSVLPLHHTFELTCGMLLPLSRGCRIVYLDELSAERLEVGLNEGRITAMVGVPALWEMLERRMVTKVAERGELASKLFDMAVELNRGLGKNLGVDAGRLLFGQVHEALGGHLRYLVSGGAALPESTHQRFSGLGLHLAEGYGLTEASPVLTVAQGGPRSRPGHVGKPIPGVEIRIHEPNAEGVGEVFARGPNVMQGYAGDEQATRGVLSEDGWLHTGDLGRVDRKGQLTIVGRAKDTIVTSSGENVYPDDVEARLGKVEHIEELAVFGVEDGRGGERIACVAVPEEDSAFDRAARHARARRSLDKALNALPLAMRPQVVTLLDVALPRTTTRKVKRRELERLLTRVAPLSERPPPRGPSETGLDAASQMVRAAISAITRRPVTELRPELTLRGDLGFDSLMLLELLVALEGQSGRAVDSERLADCLTLGDAEQLIRETRVAGRVPALDVRIETEAEAPMNLPEPVRRAAMELLGRGQMGFYDRVLKTEVTGQAYIPHNRNCLVAANHASHLDMGLVKYGLGSYGSGLVSLAAQDYFFEGGRLRKAYFENLTNLVPMSRAGSLRQSLRQAGDLLEEGKVLLVFPEGTRSVDGAIHEFKPAVGHLALQRGVDILPVYLGGTYQALPKGAVALRSFKVSVRVGPPLEIAELRRLTEGLSLTEASRRVARLTQRAVEALRDGQVLVTRRLTPEDLATKKVETVEDLFRYLEARFVPGALDAPTSYYFTLGGGERWSMQLDAERCRITQGKPEGDADCVLKTSQAMFTRIVREAYTPTPQEFIAGTVKSNNIALLLNFQKAFGLTSEAS